MSRSVFVTGGARSGKSRFAQGLVEKMTGPLLYVATAAPGDAEMAERIRRHRAERGGRWATLEEPLSLLERLPQAAEGKAGVLLDCVTLWLSNLLFHHGEEAAPVLGEVDRLALLLPRLPAPVVLVSNEVGGGIVPENPLARLFRDLAGEANQRLAAAADEAWVVVSGIPLRLK